MQYKVFVDLAAKLDIQEGIDFYNRQQQGLGKRFHAEVSIFINSLKKFPLYQMRYDDYRCLPLKNFPFMIHFTADETTKIVIIWAVPHTAQNPETSYVK